MHKNKSIRIAIITESNKGSASIIIPEICKYIKDDIVGVIHCKSIPKKKKNFYLIKLKKLLKIGFFGALIGIYIRKWFRNDLNNYLSISPLNVLCKNLNLPFYKTNGLNSIETRKKLSSLNVDLAISLGCSYISSHVFNIPKNGMINVHHELLPEYQNAQSIIWQLYNYSKITGYTVHKITKKIDDGPILFRSKRDIIFKNTLGETVSFNYANSILDSSKGLIKVIEFLKKGEFENQFIFQDGLKGSYTTPSLWSFVKIYRNWSLMKK
jgi:methionyl-tRNA formyltransferase